MILSPFFIFLSRTLLAYPEEHPTAEFSILAPSPSAGTHLEPVVSHDGEFTACHVRSTSFAEPPDVDPDPDVIYTNDRHEALLAINELIALGERRSTMQLKDTKEIPPYNGDEYRPEVVQFVNSEPIMEGEEDWNFTVTPPVRPASVQSFKLDGLREAEEGN
jgi:hypothetical protein